MASQTSAPPFDLKLHVRRIRAELEARGIWIDDELDDALMEMMRLGREANEAGRPILSDPAYKDAAVRLHRLVKLREEGSFVPQIANYTWPQLLGKVDEINRSVGNSRREVRSARRPLRRPRGVRSLPARTRIEPGAPPAPHGGAARRTRGPQRADTRSPGARLLAMPGASVPPRRSQHRSRRGP